MEFIWLTLLHTQRCSSLKEVGIGPETGQEPGGRSRCRGCGGEARSPQACLACFLIQSRTSRPGTAPPTMGWALPHQSIIKKRPYRLACSPILWKCFLDQGSFLPDDFRLCQVDKTTQHKTPEQDSRVISDQCPFLLSSQSPDSFQVRQGKHRHECTRHAGSHL